MNHYFARRFFSLSKIVSWIVLLFSSTPNPKDLQLLTWNWTHLETTVWLIISLLPICQTGKTLYTFSLLGGEAGPAAHPLAFPQNSPPPEAVRPLPAECIESWGRCGRGGCTEPPCPPVTGVVPPVQLPSPNISATAQTMPAGWAQAWALGLKAGWERNHPPFLQVSTLGPAGQATRGSHPEWGQIHRDGPGWPRAARGRAETPPGERSQVPHRRDPETPRQDPTWRQTRCRRQVGEAEGGSLTWRSSPPLWFLPDWGQNGPALYTFKANGICSFK